jgi:hypothetical protein
VTLASVHEKTVTALAMPRDGHRRSLGRYRKNTAEHEATPKKRLKTAEFKLKT